MADLTVAKTIAQQLGNQCLMMIGASNLAGDANSLTLKVGGNSKGVTHIKIALVNDLYDVTFYSCKGSEDRKRSEWSLR